MQFHAKYPLFDSQSEREFTFSYAILLNISILPDRWQKQYYIINTTSAILSIKQYLSLLNEGLPNEKHYKQNSFFKIDNHSR